MPVARDKPETELDVSEIKAPVVADVILVDDLSSLCIR